MKCVILAAGMATRMGSQTGGKPKCLLDVGGKPILQRIIENVSATGIGEIVIVLGFEAEAIRRFVKKAFPLQRIRFAVNPKYETTNNAFSLFMARDHIVEKGKDDAGASDLLLLDADIVFSPLLLPGLLKHRSSDKIAVRRAGNHDDEEVRVRVDGSGNIQEIGKTISLAESWGESIGIEIFSRKTTARLFEVLEERVRRGKGRTEYYEATFQALIDEGARLHAVDVSDHPSIEIDTPKDLEFAEKIVARKID
jgi:choline kinase